MIKYVEFLSCHISRLPKMNICRQRMRKLKIRTRRLLLLLHWLQRWYIMIFRQNMAHVQSAYFKSSRTCNIRHLYCVTSCCFFISLQDKTLLIEYIAKQPCTIPHSALYNTFVQNYLSCMKCSTNAPESKCLFYAKANLWSQRLMTDKTLM